MTIYPDVTALIGNTPLVRLNLVSELTGCEILGKAEFLNPGQSVTIQDQTVMEGADNRVPAAGCSGYGTCSLTGTASEDLRGW